ncbi:MAG: 4-phosphopantoate--beta-alanine ligase [Methanobrevibacter boviskoreani]|uniref:4-phosphopantoate--beta-alanine ligase n=1 Tax=Methanobrevibacter boviskoreani TaxID=1348249 RepID=UPI0005933E1F|nr:4-phosphopantoate--beta-alanine ligase [Methanobrevibacter boviskoreani]MCI6929861.1 phosphopantothenate/pantothenate synthetase [Methanobrevibacter boviskoreani]MDD6256629.1 4-phosphopantoate--beta-alanine ligase [Methanobrevibacter boviskoreani]MDY5614267.1 4-phosphopantoate--beta-alanine ligase [Methanobrevibacter boviskoreani]
MIPKNHPRYESLLLRDKVKNAFLDGYLADSGMIAHGRGETFDYLLGEKTVPAAEEAMKAAVASLLLAEHPVLSVNGNTTALAIDEVIELAKSTDSRIEINLFYRTEERVDKITKLFKDHGYEDILGTNYDDLYYFDKITNPRATASRQGIYIADVILVPLEDGDRAELLKEAGKKIICIDLNPLSRTSKMSDISIVDNVVRAIPEMTRLASEYKNKDEDFLLKIVNDFNNGENLKDSLDSFKIKE